jgi:hypothetical protein
LAPWNGCARAESNVISILTNRSIFGPTPDQERILAQLPSPAAGALRAALTSPPETVRLFEINGGVTPFDTADLKGSLRLDHAPNERNQLMIRANFGDLDESNASTRALVGSSRGARIEIFDSTVLAGWTRGRLPQRL